MLSLREQVDVLRKLGYGADTAQAKVVHDVVLLAMHRSGFKSNSTIKGGVVMSSLTGDVRRATMDMDIDFIRYSLGKPAVVRFVRKLARAIPEVKLKMVGEPIELKQEDYRGKRIYLAVKDASVSRRIRTKVDIGVHTRETLEQVDFSFEMADGSEPAELQANSAEQIFAEKLLSLLRHGVSSNRPKDIFDMYYLRERVGVRKLKKYVAELVYSSSRCRVKDHAALMRSVRLIFGMRTFELKLRKTRVNWLGISSAEVLDGLLAFLEKLA